MRMSNASRPFEMTIMTAAKPHHHRRRQITLIRLIDLLAMISVINDKSQIKIQLAQ